MFYLNILVLCVQAFVIQTALSQSCGCNQYSYTSAPNCGYGGTGTGQVGVSGDIGASGTTCVVGSVPVLGSVEFSGCSPSYGSISISGQCSCDSELEETCLASAASTNLFARGNTFTTAVSYQDQSSSLQPLVQRSQTALSSQCNCKQMSSPGISGRSSAPSVRTSIPSLTTTAPCISQRSSCVSQDSPRPLSQSVSQSSPSSRTGSANCASCVSSPCVKQDAPRVSQSSPSSITFSAPCSCQSLPCVSQSSSSITSPRVSSSTLKSISLNRSVSTPTCASYGGSGTGEVSVAGNIGASGTTCVVGSVPVCGSVEFSGCSPTCGTVNISGQCECECK